MHYINNLCRDIIVFSMLLDCTDAKYTLFNRGFVGIRIWFASCLHDLVCMFSLFVSVYSHLHWTLFSCLSFLCVYIISLIDFWLDYLSPTYSSQISEHRSSYPQFNPLPGVGYGGHSHTKHNNIMLTGGKAFVHSVFGWN